MQLNEALKEFEEHLPEIQAALLTNMHEDLKALERPNVSDPNLQWVKEEVYKLEVARLTEKRRQTLKRIQARRDFLKNPAQFTQSLTDEMIERAREYPIEDVFPTETRAGMGSCPFHDDRNPSCSIRKYNRYKCFSCGASGDVIDLYMKLHDASFKQAVTALQ